MALPLLVAAICFGWRVTRDTVPGRRMVLSVLLGVAAIPLTVIPALIAGCAWLGDCP